mmetsp:Transcript_765/g.3172  ORF Transcript_765/g.3172 Transcript_765/m.3172 type:complete len:226 (+) Transcript_765:2028-2705(+)
MGATSKLEGVLQERLHIQRAIHDAGVRHGDEDGSRCVQTGKRLREGARQDQRSRLGVSLRGWSGRQVRLPRARTCSRGSARTGLPTGRCDGLEGVLWQRRRAGRVRAARSIDAGLLLQSQTRAAFLRGWHTLRDVLDRHPGQGTVVPGAISCGDHPCDSGNTRRMGSQRRVGRRIRRNRRESKGAEHGVRRRGKRRWTAQDESGMPSLQKPRHWIVGFEVCGDEG